MPIFFLLQLLMVIKGFYTFTIISYSNIITLQDFRFHFLLLNQNNFTKICHQPSNSITLALLLTSLLQEFNLIVLMDFFHHRTNEEILIVVNGHKLSDLRIQWVAQIHLKKIKE